MPEVKIYRPSKTVTQSFIAKSNWILEFLPQEKKYNENLMGWVASQNTSTQIKLEFDSLDKAIDFAKKRNLKISKCSENKHIIKPKSYSENFKKLEER